MNGEIGRAARLQFMSDWLVAQVKTLIDSAVP
jgi:hypothetical protein